MPDTLTPAAPDLDAPVADWVLLQLLTGGGYRVQLTLAPQGGLTRIPALAAQRVEVAAEPAYQARAEALASRPVTAWSSAWQRLQSHREKLTALASEVTRLRQSALVAAEAGADPSPHQQAARRVAEELTDSSSVLPGFERAEAAARAEAGQALAAAVRPVARACQRQLDQGAEAAKAALIAEVGATLGRFLIAETARVQGIGADAALPTRPPGV
jgi:hypothetical protein